MKQTTCVLTIIAVIGVALLQASDCTRTSVGLTPLIDGMGLYASGLNTAPPEHVLEGEQIAETLRTWPKLVLMSVGMSNTNQKFEKFRRVELKTIDKAANLVIVNGATGKQVSESWADPLDDCYVFADQKLAVLNATPADVGVLWVMVSNAANGEYSFWRQKMKDDTRQALLTLMTHYPNVKLIFLSSRVYGGYQVPQGGLHPEPHSWDHGVVMRELITEHLDGTLLPDKWIAWGPYMWADGLIPRSDGLTYACSDFVNDGCHPSEQGATKAAAILSNFFRTDSVAKLWFLANP